MDYLLGPDEDTFKAIQNELGEDPARFDNNLKLLEEWMDCQPHLPKNYDKRMLPIYLRGCKHDMEKAKKKVELYFTVKTALPEIFTKRDPERKDIMEACEVVELAIMPRLTPAGYRVTVHRLRTNDVNKFKIDLLLARGSMSTCLRTVLETPISGDILIYDTGNITASHVAAFLTPMVKKGLIDGPEAYPNRLRQIHIVNAPAIVDKMVAIIKTLLKEKLRNRFYIHVKADTLKNYLPLYCIPSDFGGTAPKLEEMSKRTHDFVRLHTDWLKANEQMTLIGPLPEKYRYEEEFGSGTEGSFRKLVID